MTLSMKANSRHSPYTTLDMDETYYLKAAVILSVIMLNIIMMVATTLSITTFSIMTISIKG
jgi:hypothetical protein